MPMDPEISRSIFDKARDRYDKAKRIAFFSILALFLFHITTFQPFIDASSRLAHVQAENESLTLVQPKLVEMNSGLQRLKNQTSQLVNNALKQVMLLIIEDFKQLNELVAGIRRGEEIRVPASPGRLDSQQMQLGNQAMQMQVQGPAPQPGLTTQSTIDAAPPFRSLPTIDEAITDQIKQVNSVESLRRLLLPYVQENIIKVRFSEMNQMLHSNAQTIKNNAIRVRDEAKLNSKSLVSYADYFNSLGNDIDQFVQSLDELSIQPPENDKWWTSVRNKMATMDELAAAAENSLGKHLNREKSERLLNDLEKSIATNNKLTAEIDLELKALEAQFESQQTQFQNMVSSMNFGVLNLKPVTTTFPLLLALILAALSVMLSRRIHELSAAIRLMPDSQDELWEWLRRRIDMTGDTLFFDKVLSKESMIAIGSLGWVAVASWQVAGWDQVGLNNAALMYGLSVPLIAFAVWYRKRVIEALANAA